MTQEKEEVLSPAQLTKRLRSMKKKLRDLKKSSTTDTDSIEALENRVDEMASTQNTLMHNLRRMMRKLDMKPERPGG